MIEFVLKEWGRNQEPSDKFLTYKLTMLMALTSASRAVGLKHLNIRFLVKTPSSFTFTFHKLHKAWKKEKAPTSVVFHSFEKDSSLCVVAVLNEYLKISEKWTTSDEWQLLLSFVQPHKPVVDTTISGWIKNVLTISGVDAGSFKGHSIRLASTLKAALPGILVPDILKKGCWSNSSTWQTSYNKQIELPTERFQK